VTPDAIVRETCKKGGKVAVLGLSYKPGTHIIEESQSIMLAQKLIEDGYNVGVHDTKALENAKEILGDIVGYYEDVYACVNETDAVVLMKNGLEYSEMDWNVIENCVNEKAVFIDCWRMLKEMQFEKLNYIGLGLGKDTG